VKQLAKLVKVRYVEDITDSERVGTLYTLIPRASWYPVGQIADASDMACTAWSGN
jgi:hypothetical protein